MNNKKRILSILLVLVLAMATLAGCGGGSGSGTTGDTVKIGVNMELTGGVASYGESSMDGIKMAVDEINAAGGINGKQIELITGDNKSDSAEATSIATKLMTQDGVVCALGPATSGNFKATIPVATENKIPVISGSATADDVTVDANGVKEFAFRICFNDSYQGVTMANFAANKLGAKKAVIIKDNSSDYAIGLAEAFSETFTANGGEIVAEEAYVTADTDFNAILTSIKGADYDVIFIPGYYEQVGLILKQARALGITAPVLGADGYDSPTLVELAGAAGATNVYYSNHYSSKDTDPLVQSFVEKWKAAKNAEPNAFNALGYDLAYFAADAIGRATDPTDPVAIKDALASTEGFAGVTGTITVDKNHNPVKSIVVIELQKGQEVSAAKY